MRNFRLVKEDEMAGLPKSPGVTGADSFWVKRNQSNKWEVEFRFGNARGYTLCTKYYQIREFPRLNGVLRWMEKHGVKEFKVVT